MTTNVPTHFLAWLVPVASWGLAGCSKPADPPSFILVSLDTTRADAMSVYGYERDTTPRLARLASRGVVFDQCATVSENTLLSHAAMLTGLYQGTHGAMYKTAANDDRALHENYTTLAEDLSAAGYQTAGFTSHGVWLNAEFGFAQGFDVFVPSSDGADKVLARASDWLAKRDPTRPYFLFIHLFDVHSDPRGGRPYRAEAPFSGRWTAEYDGPFADWENVEPNGSLFLNAIQEGSVTLSEADRQHLRDQYDEGLATADEKLGKFLEDLPPAEHEDTWFVVTSDHGEEFREHGGFLHNATGYDEIMRVPFILVPPPSTPERLGKPRHVDAQVRIVDIRPTLAALAGLKVEKCQGQNLVPWLEGGTNVCPAGPAAFYTHVLRYNGLKLIRGKNGGLFDLRRDPGETRDLSDDRSFAKRVEAMTALLEQIGRENDVARAKIMSGAKDITVAASSEREAMLKELGYTGD